MFWIEWKSNVNAYAGNFAMFWQPWVWRIAKSAAAPTAVRKLINLTGITDVTPVT